MHVRPIATRALLLATVLTVVGCSSKVELTTAEAWTVDDDRYDIPAPPVRDPNYTWDWASRHFFLPVTRALEVSRYFRSNEAVNVNALGEVPNSSWYPNRHASERMTMDELLRGPLQGDGPDMSGSWTITRMKTQGATPGFNVRDARGDTYVIKFDHPDRQESAAGAEVIGMLFFHAAGYNVPENFLADFNPDMLEIEEGAQIANELGKKRPLTKADLDEILAPIPRRADGTIHVIASKYLSGKPLGPYSYMGLRKGDPNDIYRHEDRRELRGLKTFAAWINHVDIKGPNSLDMFVTDGDRSYMRHYLIDFGTILGVSSQRAHMPSEGHEYAIDQVQIGKQLVTLGLLGKPWDDAVSMDDPRVGFFESETFWPEKWKETYRNPAFLETTTLDAYWGAKLVMAFTPEEIGAIIDQGGHSAPGVAEYITRILVERREKVGRYWYSQVAPLDNFSVDPSGRVRFEDLGVTSGLWTSGAYHYRLVRHADGVEVDAGELGAATNVVLPPAANAGDKGEFYYYEFRVERDGVISKAVRAYLHVGDEVKLVRVDRDT